ncbi:hypothetical protein VPH35_021973 [Triticum aestivum]
MLQHGVGPGGQPLEEVAGGRRRPAPEPRVAERVQPGDERHAPERRDVQRHGGDEAERREQRRRPRVPPRQQRPHPLPLRRHVADHRLDPPGHAPQPVVPQPHHVVRLRRRERVQLLVDLVRVGRLRAGEPRVHARRPAGPAPVVPEAGHGHVQEHGREDELWEAHERDEEQVHQHGGDRVPPVAHVHEPPRHAGRAGQQRRDPEEVGLAPPHAPQVRARVQHVLHDLPPQRRLGPAQPRRHDAHRLAPERVELRDGERLDVVHLGEEGLPVQAHDAGERDGGEAHGEAELAVLAHAGRVQHDERVRVGVHLVHLQRGEAYPHLAHHLVSEDGVAGGGIGFAEVAVVEHGEREHRAGVVDLPRVLLVPPGAARVDDGARAHPLLPVLGHAVGVGGAPPVGGLHGSEPLRAEDADLEHADGRPPQLPRRRARVADVHGRLVHDVVRALEARPEVDAAGESGFRPAQRMPERLQAEPLRVDRHAVEALLEDGERQHGTPDDLVLAGVRPGLDDEHRRILERLRHNEDQLLVPRQACRIPHGARLGPEHHAADLHLGEDLDVLLPDLVADEAARHDVLCLQHVYPEVPQLRRHVHLGPRALHRGRTISATAHRRRVGVPCVPERLVGLRADPHREHDLGRQQHLAAVAHALEAVPLRRERAVGRHAQRHLADVERDPADVVVARHGVPVPDEHLEGRGLDALPGEGEHLVPLWIRLPLLVRRRAAVVAEAHLDVGAAAAGDRAHGDPARLDDAHVQVMHLLHEIISTRERPLPGAKTHPPGSAAATPTPGTAAAAGRPLGPDLWLRHCALGLVLLRSGRWRLRVEDIRVRHDRQARPPASPWLLARVGPSVVGSAVDFPGRHRRGKACKGGSTISQLS